MVLATVFLSRLQLLLLRTAATRCCCRCVLLVVRPLHRPTRPPAAVASARAAQLLSLRLPVLLLLPLVDCTCWRQAQAGKRVFTVAHTLHTHFYVYNRYVCTPLPALRA